MTTLRHRLGSAIAVAALLTLTACGGSDKDPDSKPSATSSETGDSATTSPSGDPSGSSSDIATVDPNANDGKSDFCEKQDVKTFTGPAAKEFGAENVLAAYCEMVELQYENLVPELLRRDKSEKTRVIEFSQVRDYMTPAARADWDKAAKEIASGNLENLNVIWGFMYLYVDLPEGYDYWPEGESHPTILGTKVSPATTAVDKSDGQTRLALSFRFETIANIVNSQGDPHMLTGVKDLTFTLVQNPGNTEIPWLIDGWVGEFTGSGPTKNTTGKF